MNNKGELTKEDKSAIKAAGLSIVGMLSVAAILKQLFIGFSYTYTTISILLAIICVVGFKKLKKQTKK